MSGPYNWKKFNPDFKKFDTKLLTKDLSPRNTSTHFIANSFKKISQEELKPRTTKPNTKKTQYQNDSLTQKKTQENSTATNQKDHQIDRYNSLNSEQCEKFNTNGE